jgi:hypothetical protein
MYKKFIGALGIAALLLTTFAPAYADETAVTDQLAKIASSTPEAQAEQIDMGTSTPEIPTDAVQATTTAATTTPVIKSELTDVPALLALDSATTSGATSTLSIAGSVSLPNGCDAQDTSGATHIYPEATSTQYLAICALEKAVSEGIISSYAITDSSFGVFLSSVNGIDAGATEYWAVYVNGAFASCGVGCLPLSSGDTLSLVRTDWMTNVEYDRVDIHVISLDPVYKNVIVPDLCSATTTDGTGLSFPEDGSTDKYIALCGLVAAKDQGLVSEYGIQQFSGIGAYLASVNGIVPTETQFWAVWLNGSSAAEGIGTLPLTVGDTLSLRLTDWRANEEVGQSIDLRVIGFSTTTPATTETGGSTDSAGGSDGSSSTQASLDIPSAFSFLSALQGSDGSWDELVSDWAAFAYAVPGAPSGPRSLLAKYLKSVPMRTSNVTDTERHALALMAAGVNPYTGAGADYISPIVSAFDGSQVGDPSNPRDDIFGIIVLRHAGYSAKDPMIQHMAATIVAQQQASGSWEDVDTTAAAIQALMAAGAGGSATAKAETYLKSMQQPDGGFYNPSSTAWAIQGILALGEDPSSWNRGGHTPLTYLGDIQKEDGSLSSTGNDMNRAWEVAYAIPAAKELTWNDIMKSFSKTASASTASADSVATSSAATTTASISVEATTTAAMIPTATTTVATTSATYPPAAASHAAFTVRAANAPVASSAPTTTDLSLTASAASAPGVWDALSGLFHSVMRFFASLF